MIKDVYIARRKAEGEAEDAEIVATMRRGPYYDAERGLLCIPSVAFSQAAADEWRSRGLRYDGARKEWTKAAPAERAGEVVERARAAYSKYWKLGEA